MSRLKGIFLVFSFFFINVEMQQLGRHNFTSEWLIATRNSKFPSLVTKMKDRLVYVSFPSNYTIKLETSKILNKPCEIPAAVIKERKGKNIVPLYAEPLGNGKIVVSIFESKKETNKSSVWLYVVEPQNCTFTVNTFNLDATKASARDVMTIVPYNDTFEIFVKSNIHCDPDHICALEFNDEPELISSRRRAIPFNDEGWDISATKDFDRTQGYLYIVMMSESNNTIIRSLDANLSLVHETELNYSSSIAYWYDEDGSASLCFSVTEQSIECLLLDAEMNIKTEVSIAYDSFLQYYSIFRLRDGNAIVLTILSTDPDGSDAASFVQLLSPDGEISAPVNFQDFICETVFEMNTFQTVNNLFCASTVCQSIVNTKCIGPAELREF